VLAHGPLVKADLPITLCMLLLAVTLERLWRRFTTPRVLAVGVVCGAGLLVKFTAVFFLVMVVLFLLARVLLPDKSTEATFSRRSLVAIGAALGIAVTAWVVLWAGYGFRFSAAAEPGVSLDFERVVATYCAHEREAADPHAGPLTVEDLQAWNPPLSIRATRFMYAHHLLPEAWLTGLVFIRASSFSYPHYFCGQVLTSGSWLYFPIVLAMKSPLAWLVALLAAVVLIGRRAMKAGTATLGVPLVIASTPIVLVYVLVLATSNLNEGVRHVLPLFPFVCLAIGAAAAGGWAKRVGRVAVIGLSIGLLLESAAAYPDELAYFNVAAGGTNGGIGRLGDSNLDWGQDLPALAAWQRANPDIKLYFASSGAVDPAHYGIRYTNLPGGYPLGPAMQQIREPGVIAVSASLLQGIYRSPEFNPAEFYAPIRKLPLVDVIGGTIYLYEWNPPQRR